MTSRSNGLTDFQVVAIIIAAMTGANMIFLPVFVAEKAGRDGWISIILAGLLVWLAAGLVYILCRRFPTRSLPEFSILILGKPLGTMVSTGYIVYALFLAGTTLRIYTEVAKVWTMFWTPAWFFILFLLIPVVYIVRLGPIPLARLMEIVIYVSLFVLLLFLLPLREFNLLNLRPVGQEGLRAVVSAIPETTFSYLGFEVLLIFYPMILNRQRIVRLYLQGILVAMIFFAGTTFLVIGVMGVEHVQIQVWPVMEYLGIGRLPVVERIDNLFLFYWTGKIVGLISIHYYAAAFTAASLTSRRYYSLWTLLFIPIIYAIALLPGRQLESFDMIRIVGNWGVVFILFLVVLLLMVAVIRGLDEGKGVPEK
ncbi:GerAB/ArcD/ProY family transporter [Candidatus Contubernalis alkaliaceticus]|uniref:GerAB/ArcD/ProY family transporter n=1 Tax=Candidatus Contubernalis alkaliaceticus TaxID=338645 RepID=UPI001F4C38B6|nr:GerAB/ArcD/ProY family transporter [Candidatus Contubernalis alkalaceticus]UNC91010.1 GerAB/ArcD/ProY family transporter [Candidatus Contubernalis alkalaceticus]